MRFRDHRHAAFVLGGGTRERDDDEAQEKQPDDEERQISEGPAACDRGICSGEEPKRRELHDGRTFSSEQVRHDGNR